MSTLTWLNVVAGFITAAGAVALFYSLRQGP